MAEGISLQFDGETVNSKDEAKLNALPTEPSAALIASVRDLCAAKTMQQKESALRTIYEVAALAYGYPVEVFGSVSFAAALETHFTAGGALHSRRDAGSDEVTSRELSVTTLTAIRTLDEAAADQKSTRILLARGTLNIPSLYDTVSNKRVYSVAKRTEFMLKCRSHFQQTLVKAIIIALESLVENRTNPSLTQEYSTLVTLAKEADTKKLYWAEVFGSPSPTSSLMTLVVPNLHAGSNLIALILFTHRDRFRDKDIPQLGEALSQLVMPADMDPSTFFVQCQKLRESLGEPAPDVNYAEFGLIVQEGTQGEPSSFKVVSDKSIVGITMLQLDKRIALNPTLHPARSVITAEVMQSVKDGTFTTAAFHAAMTTLATENIPTTLPAGSVSQDTAFGAIGNGGKTVSGGGGKGGGATGGGSGSGKTGSGGGGGGGSGTKGSSGGGGSSKGGGGGSGGAAAGAPRGRTQDKAAPAQRPASLAPGDSTGVACYARFVALLGPKMENLVACAGLINKYFKDTVGQDALLSDHGVVRVPLVLASNFAWKAMTNKFKNHNARRDIYAAWCVLRDRCSGKGRGLTAYGKEYKVSHPTWENLAADEFAALYTPAPASAKTKFTLGTFVIRGVTVTEFSA